MRPEDRRLVALAAALVPARAAALLGRLAGGAPLGREAALLAVAPRRARLAALASALAAQPAAAPAAARAVSRATSPGRAHHPLLARLGEEVRWRAAGVAAVRPERPWAGARTTVRPAAGPAATGPRDPAALALARPVD